MVAEDWMQSDYDELLGIKSQMDVLKDRKKELEEELEKAIMGFAAIYGKDGETVLATRVPKTPKPELDRELLRKEYESVYDKYLLVQEAVFNEALFKKECRDLYDQYLALRFRPQGLQNERRRGRVEGKRPHDRGHQEAP